MDSDSAVSTGTRPSAVVGWGAVALLVFGLATPLMQLVLITELGTQLSDLLMLLVRCAALFAAGTALTWFLVGYAGAPSQLWLGVALFVVIEIGRIAAHALGFGPANWSGLPPDERMANTVQAVLPLLFGVLGAWSGQRFPRRSGSASSV